MVRKPCTWRKIFLWQESPEPGGRFFCGKRVPNQAEDFFVARESRTGLKLIIFLISSFPFLRSPFFLFLFRFSALPFFLLLFPLFRFRLPVFFFSFFRSFVFAFLFFSSPFFALSFSPSCFFLPLFPLFRFRLPASLPFFFPFRLRFFFRHLCLSLFL